MSFMRARRALPTMAMCQRSWIQGMATLPPREKMYYDSLIVGAGPAGLAAAIRLKQMAVANNKDISVCVVEKGSEVGAHVLSGNVFEPRAMDELFPDWRKDMENGPPIQTKAKDDTFLVLTGPTGAVSIPNFLLPPELHNDGNYIISLSQLVRWLAGKAEELGVEIYPGKQSNASPHMINTRYTNDELRFPRQASLLLKYSTMPPAAACREWPQRTQVSARTANKRIRSHEVWSCSHDRRSSQRGHEVGSFIQHSYLIHSIDRYPYSLAFIPHSRQLF